ncbi:MAG: phenylalanine--tRNA ligase subunit alpha [DPANN group archaeon]|nr:phenylalanine--tRNA ligase subunit alpha [DPANN group archaeon]
MKYNLQYHEILLLKKLLEKNDICLNDITDIDQAAVIRASMTLSKLKLTNVKEEDKLVLDLSDKGVNIIKNGLPERQILIAIGNGLELEKIKIKDKNVGVGFAKKQGLIDIQKDKNNLVVATDTGKKYLKTKDIIQDALENIKKGIKIDSKMIDTLTKRSLIKSTFRTIRTIKATAIGLKVADETKLVKEISRLTPKHLTTGEWKNVTFRKYNVVAPVAKMYNGRKHPLRVIMNRIRDVFVEMGFKEMNGPLVETAFWCMDSMFIPQDHPAREAQDTFHLPLIGDLPDKKIVDKVKNVHTTGGKCGSKGYGYAWDDNEAKKVLLRTHTTATTFRYFGIEKIKPPAKYFCIDRVFRNEALDATHGAEFFQVEGLIMDKDLTLGNLKSSIKEFYSKFGIDKIKFKPTYNPYTEPSMEAFAYHEGLGKWIELINSGIFRPEALEPFNIDVPVIAWGLSPERLAMLVYNKNSIHDLLGPTCDLEWLRTYKVPKREI